MGDDYRLQHNLQENLSHFQGKRNKAKCHSAGCAKQVQGSTGGVQGPGLCGGGCEIPTKLEVWGAGPEGVTDGI